MNARARLPQSRETRRESEPAGGPRGLVHAGVPGLGEESGRQPDRAGLFVPKSRDREGRSADSASARAHSLAKSRDSAVEKPERSQRSRSGLAEAHRVTNKPARSSNRPTSGTDPPERPPGRPAKSRRTKRLEPGRPPRGGGRRAFLEEPDPPLEPARSLFEPPALALEELDIDSDGHEPTRGTVSLEPGRRRACRFDPCSD
jgi:hypothetical protein